MRFIIIIFSFLICTASANFRACTKGYYWRDYVKGNIPEDAVPAGVDNNGVTVYVGQNFHTGFVFAGVIRAGEDADIYDSVVFKRLPPAAFIKILCTCYAEDLEWVPATTYTMQSLSNKHLVLGGYSPYEIFRDFIGRAYRDGRVILGPVTITSNPRGLLNIKDGLPATYDSYDVLSYNPKVRSNIGGNVARNVTLLTVYETFTDDGNCPRQSVNVYVP